MKKLNPDPLMLNGYHRIMHLAVFLLGYASASVFGVFILCSSLGNSLTAQLYPYFLRFVELYIDWSAGFCLVMVLLYLAVEFIRSECFPESYDKENVFLRHVFNAVDRLTVGKIQKAFFSIINKSGRRG